MIFINTLSCRILLKIRIHYLLYLLPISLQFLFISGTEIFEEIGKPRFHLFLWFAMLFFSILDTLLGAWSRYISNNSFGRFVWIFLVLILYYFCNPVKFDPSLFIMHVVHNIGNRLHEESWNILMEFVIFC